MEIRIDNDGGTSSHFFYKKSEPGLVILLVDQTQLSNYQMNNPQDNHSIAKDVNNFIYNLLLSNVNGDKIKDSCFLKLISYADEKFEIKEGWLSFFADNPIEIKKKIQKTIKYNTEIEDYEPIWIENKNIGSPPTNIDLIENHIKEWHFDKDSEYPESIIVHFYRDENNEIAQLVKYFIGNKLSFKRPIHIEKIIK